MLTNWPTTRRDGKPNKCRVGGELVEFQRIWGGNEEI